MHLLEFLLQANKKTRNRAYDILVQIGHAFGDEEKGGKKENLLQFFNMVWNLLSSCDDNQFVDIEVVVFFLIKK